jgi:hypothetical protein
VFAVEIFHVIHTADLFDDIGLVFCTDAHVTTQLLQYMPPLGVNARERF